MRKRKKIKARERLRTAARQIDALHDRLCAADAHRAHLEREHALAVEALARALPSGGPRAAIETWQLDGPWLVHRLCPEVWISALLVRWRRS
jgi:hypothetical protein